ncbi:1-hydroxycarotenoid 3,4-desaturase CrtD [Methylobacterium sp. 77]|uniref:1-hydroxycarotenoid 3,4-desaturase CrtD n=1 Tax=Methylobacterium sp. 77 TaxID=1101192 RepID=UPI00039AA3B3|nr:1-hydroxycarotenoid 3,4-desaturase CrtD [Methylobacterium sp. 77]
MATKRVAVIGAGIGGLVAALRLAHAGLDVTVLERAAGPGGKMRSVPVEGSRVEAGPTVFTMRWVFEEIFSQCGADLSDRLRLHPASILARHAWGDGERLDLFADHDASAEAIRAFAGAREEDGYRRFCARAAEVYGTLERPFIRGERPSPIDLGRRVGLSGLGGLLRIQPFTTLWSALGDYFRDPRLRQLFGRYATYCGSSPFEAPATLMLVAHVESEGVWHVEGGFSRLAAVIADLAEERGARFRYNSHVAGIAVENGRGIVGLDLADGERIPADLVVANADAAALGKGLFGARASRAVGAVPPGERSLSAVTLCAKARISGFPLVRHNVFFSRDYAAEFAELRAGRLPADPTVYVCAQDRADDDSALGAPERLLCLVNAPALGLERPLDPMEIARCETNLRRKLTQSGLTIEDSLGTVTTDPAGFERLFPATGGALYGRASHGWMASFKRPGARTALPGLYLAGGSVHPGPGVPMAAQSGRIAADSLLDDLGTTGRASIRQWQKTATSGGMSTP